MIGYEENKTGGGVVSYFLSFLFFFFFFSGLGACVKYIVRVLSAASSPLPFYGITVVKLEECYCYILAFVWGEGVYNINCRVGWLI